MGVYEIIKQIAATSSRNEKQAILEAHKDNELLKKVLYYTYESKLNYYIRAFPYGVFASVDTGPDQNSLENAFDLLDKLNTRQITGHAALKAVADFYWALDDNHNAEIFKRIIERDMRAGFSGGTTNKVFPGLVTDFPCMLAQTPDSMQDIVYPAMAQLKKDGCRAFAIPGANKEFYFSSRNGKLIDVGNQLVTGIGTINNTFVFDGELTIFGMDRKKSAGIINHINKASAILVDKKEKLCLLKMKLERLQKELTDSQII